MLKLESTTETTILQELTQTYMKPLVTLGTTTLFIFTTPKTLSRRTQIFFHCRFSSFVFHFVTKIYTPFIAFIIILFDD